MEEQVRCDIPVMKADFEVSFLGGVGLGLAILFSNSFRNIYLCVLQRLLNAKAFARKIMQMHGVYAPEAAAFATIYQRMVLVIVIVVKKHELSS